MDILITSCPASGQILSILAKRAPEASERQGASLVSWASAGGRDFLELSERYLGPCFSATKPRSSTTDEHNFTRTNTGL